MGGWGYIFFRKFTLVTFLKVWPSWHMFPVLYPRDILHFYFYPRDITHSTLVTFLFSPSWQGWGYIFLSLTLVTFLPWPSWHKDYIPSWHKKQLPSWLYILTPLCTVIKWKSPLWISFVNCGDVGQTSNEIFTSHSMEWRWVRNKILDFQ